MATKFSSEEKYLISLKLPISKLIQQNGPINFSAKKKDPFNELVNIVISQFISTKAAAGIKKKMLISLNEKKFSTHSFQKLSIQEIKDLGLSTNKAKSIKELEKYFLSQTTKNSIFKLSKTDREKELLNIFGIGPWSVEMFEMFCARDLNIFSPGDAALREAMKTLNMVDSKDFQEYTQYAEKWNPYKTIACLHLWHFIEN
jgi:DNA-3-methyladenine glycosylase II